MRIAVGITLVLALILPGVVLAADLNTKKAFEELAGLTLAPDNELVFVVLGDSRGGDDIYLALLDDALRHKPWFVIHTGDMVNSGGQDELVHYESLIADYPVPVIHSPGNHDVSDENTAFADMGGELNWRFDIGSYTFLGLDTSSWDLTDMAMDMAHAALTGGRQYFVTFHQPPYVGRWQVHAMSPDEDGGRGGELMPLIDKVHTRGVFLGHIHLLDMMRIGGVPYFISGGGGAYLHHKYGFGRPEYGYLVIRIKYGIVDYEWVSLEVDQANAS